MIAANEANGKAPDPRIVAVAEGKSLRSAAADVKVESASGDDKE